MKLKHLAAAAALVVSAGAHAQTTPVFELVNGNFFAPYFFSLTAPLSDVVGDVNSVGVTWTGVQLVSTGLGYSAFDTNPDDGFSFLGLAAGSYVLNFAGTGLGGFGGYYSVTAVPEPETYAMMLAGLAIMGFMAARRRQG